MAQKFPADEKKCFSFRKYEHAFPEDLYSAFDAAVDVELGTDIAAFIKYWVEEPGYPVLHVNVDMSTGVISLEQVRADKIHTYSAGLVSF